MLRIILFLGLLSNPLFGTINWSHNYHDSLKKAQEKQKPLLLYISTPDPLSWRMEKQILETRDFSEQTAGQFIFVRIDLDRNAKTIQAGSIETEFLKNNLEVESFPCLLIVSPEGKRLAERSFIPVEAKKYAEHLLEISKDYRELKSGMNKLDKLDAVTLKELYIKAKTFQQKQEMQRLLDLGRKSNEKVYFLSEYLSFLSENGKISSKKARKVRKELLELDEDNKQGKHRFVALLEFQHLASLGNADPLGAVTPLMNYLETFEDPQNDWRVEMTISQYLFSQNKINEAIEFANHSYKKAPSKRKASIKMAIEHMTAQLQSPIK